MRRRDLSDEITAIIWKRAELTQDYNYPKQKDTENKPRIGLSERLKVGFGFFFVLSVLFVIAVVFHQPVLPDPLPDYPGATKLPSSASLPYELLSSSCYTLEAFEGEKYRAFLTSDFKGQIKDFYQQAAAKQGFGFVGEEHFFEIYSNSVSEAVCFSNEITGVMFSSKVPALAVRVLDWENSEDAKYITQFFPQTPRDHKVILVMEGLKFRTIG